MKPIVFSNPGHGGVDSGAVNTEHGLTEKRVNLAVAREAHTIFERDGLVESILFRADDTFQSLSNIVEVSNHVGSNLFISYHCNSASNPHAHGMETFYYTFTRVSQRVARLFQSALTEEFPARADRGAKPANFYVLRETNCPAVLLEMEFLHNSRGAFFLSKKNTHKRMAQAVVRATYQALEIPLPPKPAHPLRRAVGRLLSPRTPTH